MKLILSRFALDESGATAIEYGLIAGLVSIVIVASLTTIGASLTNTFTAVNGAFAGAGN